MTEAEGHLRMTAVAEQLIKKFEPFTDGGSIIVLENAIESPYGVTPNEDVARLATTMFAAITQSVEFGIRLGLNAERASANTFGVYPPVKKGKSV